MGADVTVETLIGDAREQACRVLAEAFAQDPVNTQVMPAGDIARGIAYHRALLRYNPDWVIDVARDADGAVLGAAMWEPPASAHAWWRMVALTFALLRVLGWRGMSAGARIERAAASHRPKEAHWYLAEIGVGGAARGRGVGSALLRYRLDLLDRERAAGYLEATSEGSRALYERHGFEVLAPIPEWQPATAHAMWRAAGTDDAPPQSRGE